MQNQRGFIGVGVLIAILVGVAVIGGGIYYVVNQQPTTQTATENFNDIQTSPTTNKNNEPIQPAANNVKSQIPTPTKISFTAPIAGAVLKVGGTYAASWTGQSSSDQTMIILKAADPSCWNVGLVAEGERGCSAIELGKVKLSAGSFQLNLNSGASPLSQLSNRDSKTNYVLFFDAPGGRVTSEAFSVQGNDFTITPSIEKTSFAPGETLHFSVHGATDTGVALSPELGFSAKVFMEWGNNWGSGGSAIYHEGTYNQGTKQWDFVTTAPTTLKNDYRIFLYVKCSNQNLCAQKYPNLLEKDTLLKFNVSN